MYFSLSGCLLICKFLCSCLSLCLFTFSNCVHFDLLYFISMIISVCVLNAWLFYVLSSFPGHNDRWATTIWVRGSAKTKKRENVSTFDTLFLQKAGKTEERGEQTRQKRENSCNTLQLSLLQAPTTQREGGEQMIHNKKKERKIMAASFFSQISGLRIHHVSTIFPGQQNFYFFMMKNHFCRQKSLKQKKKPTLYEILCQERPKH